MASPPASAANSLPPTRPIPGSYGFPLLGPLRDRLDYFWFQGQSSFFRSRAAKLNSTVFRVNMPPTFPFFLGVDSRVVALTDCISFSALFDPSLIDKRDVLIGPYMPSVSYTGGTRVVVYRDTTEPEHTAVKSFCLELLRRSAKVWTAELLKSLDVMLSGIERELLPSSGKKQAGFLLPLQKCLFTFLCKGLIGADPAADPLVDQAGFALFDKWLALQLLPTQPIGVVQPLEELFLHSFPYPAFLVRGPYDKIYSFVEKNAGEAIRLAVETYGLKKEDAINNILFVLGFNAFGGFSVFFPALISNIGSKDRAGLRRELREEVRSVLASGAGDGAGAALDVKAIKQMELVKSTVYEVLRMNPPVPLQFGRAREGFLLRSHCSSYQVQKGELLCGYQPLAMRDPQVFADPDKFVPNRFMSERGRQLLDYVYWSNGPETAEPTADNKQCAAKEYVVAAACLLVAELFRRYDDYECDKLSITKLVKATPTDSDPVAGASLVSQEG